MDNDTKINQFIALGTVIAAISYVLSDDMIQGAEIRIFSLLLALIAVGLFGIIWQQKTNTDDLSPVVGMAILLGAAAYFLGGIERINIILLSFIVAGIFGLLNTD